MIPIKHDSDKTNGSKDEPNLVFDAGIVAYMELKTSTHVIRQHELHEHP